jgi:carbon storage regulator
MLVIRRRSGESLLIGADVELEVLEIGHSQVKLGIRAPRTITVLRKEIQLTMEQNRASSNTISQEEIARLRGAFKRAVQTD